MAARLVSLTRQRTRRTIRRAPDARRRRVRTPQPDSRSRNTWQQQAEQFLVGGVNSPVRTFRPIDDDPLYIASARGAQMTATDGQSFIDFIMGWGTLILGHQAPAVVRAVEQAARNGLAFGLTTPNEIELARLITTAVPSVEKVRLTVSGTEACMTAIRLCRAITKRSHVVLMEGGYHGHSDSLLAGITTGIPDPVTRHTIRVGWNDVAAVEQLFADAERPIACVMVEPVPANMGVVPPHQGYLAQLRELTRRHGALLVFDEVVTGFRVGPGGAQMLFNVQPDLTVFGKIIGGGLPIGAIGGPARLMDRLAPLGDVYHAGTFAGHPLTMAAGVATLRELARRPPYQRLEMLGHRLADGLGKAARSAGVPVTINRIGSLLTIFFTDPPVHNWTQAVTTHRSSFAQWAQVMRQQGLLVPPAPLEAWFISTAHTPRHIDQTVRAAADAFAACALTTQEIARGLK